MRILLELSGDTIIVRRARCAVCNTSLVMDYEWFEPNTIWLVRPTWMKVSGQNFETCRNSPLLIKYQRKEVKRLM